MPTITADKLKDFVERLYQACGDTEPDIAQAVADSLVQSNLKGHDSHGVLRAPVYVQWIEDGFLQPNARPTVVRDRGAILVIDGHHGFGQFVARAATELAVAKAKSEGVCVLAVRHGTHMGRLGEFSEMAAAEELVTYGMINGGGSAILVAPYGGIERRLSANPIFAGAPRTGGRPPIILDMATCTIAEGKIKVAQVEAKPVPPGNLLDGQGEATTDPAAFYADPPGAILPIAGHKGYGLSMFADILGGALTGALCSERFDGTVDNAMFCTFADPEQFGGLEHYQQQLEKLCGLIKSTPLATGFDEILLPGEPEERTFRERTKNGIPLPPALLEELVELAKKKGVSPPEAM